MDFRRPLWGLAPSLEGEALRVLSAADEEFSGRRVHQLIGRGSEEGARRALNRLVDEGLVSARKAGQATMYRFNREHLAAPYIDGLMSLRGVLLRRLRDVVARWDVQPVAAAVFGSVARGEAGPDSDLDLFFVRPSGADETQWQAQVAALAEAATVWTGNDARPLEFGEEEIEAGGADETVIRDVLEHGIEIGGSLRRLRRRRRRP